MPLLPCSVKGPGTGVTHSMIPYNKLEIGKDSRDVQDLSLKLQRPMECETRRLLKAVTFLEMIRNGKLRSRRFLPKVMAA